MVELSFVFLVVILATFYSFIFEYFVHKYVLHNYKRFKFAFKNHMSIHHKTSRKNDMYDPGYENFISSYFEHISLGLVAAIHIPILFVSPVFFYALLVNIVHYYYVHRRSHIDTEWGKVNLPWHYAHHMGKNQNMNWGIRTPLIDKILGTSSY